MDADFVKNQLPQRYKLREELGRGSMGIVYLAHDLQLDRPVAIKFLGSMLDSNEEYRQLFLREARTAARVNHPNIVPIYEINVERGRAYIAMEFVEGSSLYPHVKAKQRLSLEEMLDITAQIGSALSAIHEVGLVHRDLKPENILLGPSGLVKLTDFGLAKDENMRLTAPGQVLGSPPYMAPEQVRGEETDPRTDIYALGLIMYEMLTGATVFEQGDILRRQCNEVPGPPSAAVDGVPPAVDRIILKCIQKDPAERYPSITALIHDVQQVGVGSRDL